MPKKSKPTTHDLVVRSVLSEGPAHGYRLLQILEERDVRDWAAMSKPQVYYSLKKLLGLKLVKQKSSHRASVNTGAGPEREVLVLSSAGHQALLTGLNDELWATQRPAPPFLTWIALCAHLDSSIRAAIIERRRTFLNLELARERETLKTFPAIPSLLSAAGSLMVTLKVKQFELELAWLNDVENALVRNIQ